MNKKLLANVRFYFAQSVFNTTCHRKAYDRFYRKKRNYSNIVLIFSSVTLILLVLQIIGLKNDVELLLGIVAFIGLILTGCSLLFEMFNKEDISLSMSQHNLFAEKYKSLRDEYMSLIEEIMSNSDEEIILRTKRDVLQKKYSEIGEYALPTTYSDYENSQKSLGISGCKEEEFTWSNIEIDKFLPKELRLY